jgi:lysyl endopeptidase
MKTTNRLIIIFISLLIAIASKETNAQISYGGTPPGILYSLSDTENELIALSPPDMDAVMAEDIENQRNTAPKPRRMGVSVVVDKDMHEAGVWSELADGSKLWRLRLHVEGALALGVYYDMFSLPEGGRLFLYNKDRTQVLGAFTHLNNHESGLFANEFIQGEEVILEYIEDANAKGQAVIRISELAYAYRDIKFETREIDGIESLWCMINVACAEGDGWEDQIRSAARISIKIGWSYFWCSGALINNTLNNREPYFLTASHCGGNASPSDLNQWIFYFNYQAATCNGSSSSSNTITGCQLKARDPSQADNGSDFYLVKFNNNVPDSYNVYYSGWNRSISNQEMINGVSIHHPAGDIKKISTYSTSLVSSTGWNGLQSHWMAVWAETENGKSIVEGGSSGSPIYDRNGLIVGDLTGGYESNSCETPSPAFYGKIWYSWESNGTTPETRLKDWLDPFEAEPIMHPGVNWAIVPPTADFLADDQNVQQGHSISFTDLSGPDILSWFWEFEGGTPSTAEGQDPGTILYTEPGSYAVSLTVTNADGTDTETKEDYIMVFAAPPPIADFTSDHTEIGAGGTVRFTDASSGDPFEWSWEFEGGSPATSSLQNPTIRYNNPGLYTVSLTATGYGGSDTKTVEEYINVLEVVLPEADFEASQTLIFNGESIDFTDISFGEPIAWYWEFEGGIPPSSEEQHPVDITYPNPGAYDVSLTVANQFGQHTATKTDYIIVDLVGLTENNSHKIKITPNPSSGIFYIKIDGKVNGMLDIKVLDQTGRLIQQTQHQPKNDDLQLDLTSFTNGIYLLVVEIADEKFYKRIQILK